MRSLSTIYKRSLLPGICHNETVYSSSSASLSLLSLSTLIISVINSVLDLQWLVYQICLEVQLQIIIKLEKSGCDVDISKKLYWPLILLFPPGLKMLFSNEDLILPIEYNIIKSLDKTKLNKVAQHGGLQCTGITHVYIGLILKVRF